VKKLAGVTAVLVVLGMMLAGPAFARKYPPTKATCGVSDNTLAPGDEVTVSGENWKPETTVKIRLVPEQIVLATVTTDTDGAFSTVVTIPDDIRPGPHRIVCTGRGHQGGIRVLGTNITILGDVGGVGAAGIAGTGAPSTVPLWAALATFLALAGGTALIFARRRQRGATVDRS